MEENNQQPLSTDNVNQTAADHQLAQPDSLHQPLTSNETTASVQQVASAGNVPSDLVPSETQSLSVANTAADQNVDDPLEPAAVIGDNSGPRAPGNVTESAPAAMTARASIGLLTNGLNRLSSHEMDLAELKVKIICQEKNNQALKMELKCAELQVAAKEKLDVKKTRLIELLDAKLTAVEKKNVRLVEMMEQVLRDKDTHTHRLMDATKNMEDLSKRLAESEKARSDMRNINRELKTMLDNVEGKGTQIAKLAKEKVLKYKVENERIQRELDGLMKGSGEDDDTLQGTTEEVVVSTNDHEDGTLEPAGKAQQLCRQLDEAIASKNWQEESVENLRAVLAEVGPLFGALRQRLILDLSPSSSSSEVRTVAALQVAEADNTKRETTEREKHYKHDIEAKDCEIATLKDELNRLKSAIGQLVGLNMSALAAAALT